MSIDTSRLSTSASRLFVFAAAILSHVGCNATAVSGQQSQTPNGTVTAQYQAMVDAYGRADAKGFSNCLSGQCSGTGFFPAHYAYAGSRSGKVDRKQVEACFTGWMRDYAPANPKFPRPYMEFLPTKSVEAGNSTTVTGFLYVVMPRSATEPGNEDGTFSVQDVWQRENGKWLLVSRTMKLDDQTGYEAMNSPANRSRLIKAKG